MQAHQSKHSIGGSTIRERERERDECVLFEFRQFFFTLGTRLCIDLCKKSDRTRCLAVSILEYTGFIRVREMSGKFKFFQGQGIVREFYAVSVKNEV